MNPETVFNALVQDLSRGASPPGEFPWSAFQLLGRERVFGFILPQDLGGSGLPAEQLFDFNLRTALRSPGFALGMGSQLVNAQVLAEHGNPGQRRTWLERLITGETLAALACTDAAEAQVTAQADPDHGFHLSGRKTLITWSGRAELYLLLARVQLDPQTSRPSVFLVPRSTPGLKFTALPSPLGFPELEIGEIHLDAVVLSREALVGRVGDGLKVVQTGIQLGRLGVATTAVAHAQNSLAEARRSLDRVRGHGTPLGQHEHARFQFAELQLAWESSRALVAHAWQAWAQDPSQALHLIAAAKLSSARTAVTLADQALQLTSGLAGLSGSLAENRCQQARLFHWLEGSEAALLETIAQRSLNQTDPRSEMEGVERDPGSE